MLRKRLSQLEKDLLVTHLTTSTSTSEKTTIQSRLKSLRPPSPPPPKFLPPPPSSSSPPLPFEESLQELAMLQRRQQQQQQQPQRTFSRNLKKKQADFSPPLQTTTAGNFVLCDAKFLRFGFLFLSHQGSTRPFGGRWGASPWTNATCAASTGRGGGGGFGGFARRRLSSYPGGESFSAKGRVGRFPDANNNCNRSSTASGSGFQLGGFVAKNHAGGGKTRLPQV